VFGLVTLRLAHLINFRSAPTANATKPPLANATSPGNKTDRSANASETKADYRCVIKRFHRFNLIQIKSM
jgi:hypothetical protein